MKIQEFFASPYFHDLPEVPGAARTLQRFAADPRARGHSTDAGQDAHNRLFNFVLVTSRQLAIRDTSLRWLNVHFPYVFSDVM